jgi:glycerol-3-phosphate dehydrogenase
VLVQTTLWGNLILGPTARDKHDPAMMNQSVEDIQTFIFSKCKHLVPSFDPKETIHSFCGVRAKSSRNDWVIEPSAANPNFIHAAGIDSPGLAGSPAIAVEVVRLLSDAGLALSPNTGFNPNRFPMICPKSGWKGIRAGPVGKFTNPAENIICKCEKVTEAEVIAACHGPLPIDSTQAIRKRTRAGMGHCQGNEENYDCERRVAAIIARELNMKIEAVGRRPWPATSTLPQRWISDDDKEKLVRLKEDF